MELNASQIPGDCPGGMGGFGIDWYIRLQINLPAFETKTKYVALTVSMETVHMVKSRPRKNQSERSDLPCQNYNKGEIFPFI